MIFDSTENEAQFIEKVRGIFRAYLPESDAWAKPNFFDINSTVIGGLAWSAVNEARNGVDARVNLQTMVGENLDIYASTPPLDLTRLSATQSSGFVSLCKEGANSIEKGEIIQTEGGIEFSVVQDTALDAQGCGTVEVQSVEFGKANNSPPGQPLEGDDITATSLGIFGAFDAECDDEFRRRIYAERIKFHFFGSACSYEDLLLGVRGVSRVWPVEDGGVPMILFLMEDKYPCGEPRQEDYDAITQMLEDECLTNMFFCPRFGAPETLKITPEIRWESEPDWCAVEEAITKWLRENHTMGDDVSPQQLQCFLDDEFSEFGPKVICCDLYEAECTQIYNCVELMHTC